MKLKRKLIYSPKNRVTFNLLWNIFLNRTVYRKKILKERNQKWITPKDRPNCFFTQEFIDKDKQMYSTHYDNVKTDEQGFVVSVGLPKIFIEKDGKYVNINDETEEVSEIAFLINTIMELKIIIGPSGAGMQELKDKLLKYENRLKYLTSTK